MDKTLNREQRRQAERYLAEQNKKFPDQLTVVPRDAWPPELGGNERLTQVLRSKTFLVQVFKEKDPVAVRLSILRTALSGNDWKAEITWDELQRLKAEAGYSHYAAVEVYPPEPLVVNIANIRHLWVYRSAMDLPFMWGLKNGG
jgi:hypothetical protein